MGYTPPSLYVNKVTGGWAIYPPSSITTDDLIIKANLTDIFASIKIEGTGKIYLNTDGANQIVLQASGTTNYLIINYSTPDVTLDTVADKNLFLKTNGTGLVKFGAYTAGAATDSTGYISILDAAGNARKLMVQA